MWKTASPKSLNVFLGTFLFSRIILKLVEFLTQQENHRALVEFRTEKHPVKSRFATPQEGNF